ncbi:MAG: hypothetical protein IK079_01225, partial [Desulfovibrio sp.]|nr:hypothetical protein [Desulfovibrio sp.]
QTRFPEITFIDCCMMPTMRKSGPNDEQRTKAKMYDGIKPVSAPEKNSISIIGMEQNLHECLLLSILRENGYTIRSLPLCKTYTDYQELGKSKTMLTLSDDAFLAGQQLATRMNANHIHLPIRYTPDAILEDLNTLIHTLKLTVDPKKLEQAKIFALTSLKKAADSLSKTPLALDYTFAPRTLNLAKLLLECGFSLTTLYLDAFNSAEEADFKDLQKYPLTLVQTVAPLRTYPAPTHTLCLGQKAAYFSGSTHFVNCVGGGGLCDFSGLSTLADLIMDAHTKPKNLRQTLLHKGLGLPSFITQPLWDYHA